MPPNRRLNNARATANPCLAKRSLPRYRNTPVWLGARREDCMGEHITLDEAIRQRDSLRAAGKTLVFTNGHFDLLHAGHLDYLEKARAEGDALFLGLNGDASTTRLKGPGRPIVPAVERARLLAALEPVTAVIIFDDDTADGLISALQPDVYVKGGDYAHKHLPERPAVEAYGGRVALIDYLPGHSTTALIARIKALPDA
jgi:rfaE bifunctional protein nucleotidyltransferase chain/domain